MQALGAEPALALTGATATPSDRERAEAVLRVLALALPVTLVPLLLLTMSPAVMGSLRPGPIVRVAAVVVTALITIMDVALLSLLFTGRLG